MFEGKSESEAREQILQMGEEYCGRFHNSRKLEFWLTSGRYTRRFEEQMAKYLSVRFL